MNYRLAANILKNHWYIGVEEALSYTPIINGLLSGHEVDFQFNKDAYKEESEQFTEIIKSEDVTYFNAKRWTDFSAIPYGSVCVVSIEGPMMKADELCSIGTASVGNILKKAAASKNVAAIVLRIDSPGGTVDGTKDLADIVESINKPVIAFADGLMASAAIWVGSAAQEVWASQPHTQVGSVGVMLSFADMQPAYEKLGVKFHAITAPQSEEKNKLWQDLRDGKYDEFKKEVLAPLADEFISTMKTFRPNLEEKHLKGKVFFAKDVVGSFVDNIGSLDEAILRAKSLTDTGNESTSGNSEIDAKEKSNQNHTEMNLEHVNATLGVNLESADGSFNLTTDQMEAINTALGTNASLDKQVKDATSAKEKAEQDLAAANTKISEHETTISEKDQEIESLKNGNGEEIPGAKEEGTKGGDQFDTVEKANSLFESLPE